MFKKIIYMTILTLAFAATAQASWYMELTNVDGTLAEGYYTMDINFVTDDPTTNINDFYWTIDYDETLVSYAAYVAEEYDDGASPFPTVLWECPLPETDTGELVYNILGSESLGHAGEYFPGAGSTLMGTLWFEVNAGVSGFYTDIGLFVDGPSDDLVTVNLVDSYMFPEVTQTKEGNTYRLSPPSAVPIPGAVWLLGSGLLGMLGIRRRNKN